MSASPLSSARFRIGFSIAWIALMIDHSIILHWFGLPWKESIIDSAISNSTLLLFCLLVLNTLRYYLPRREQVINVFAWCIFFSIIWLLLTKWLLRLALGDFPGYSENLSHASPVRFSLAFLILAAVAGNTRSVPLIVGQKSIA